MWYPIASRYGRRPRYFDPSSPPPNRPPPLHLHHPQAMRAFGVSPVSPSWPAHFPSSTQLSETTDSSNISTPTSGSDEVYITQRYLEGLAASESRAVSFRDRKFGKPALKPDIVGTILRLDGAIIVLQDVALCLDPELALDEKAITSDQLAMAVQVNKALGTVLQLLGEMKELRENSGRHERMDYATEQVAQSLDMATTSIRTQIAQAAADVQKWRAVARPDRRQRDEIDQREFEKEKLEVRLARIVKKAVERDSASSRDRERSEDLDKLRSEMPGYSRRDGDNEAGDQGNGFGSR